MNEQAQAVLATLFPRTGRRYAMCLKKMGYPTLEDAETVRRRRQPLTEEILRIYGPCDYCTLWHLTHKPWGLAKLQRERALLLAFAADAPEAQRVDRETDQRLREFEAMVTADIDGFHRLYMRYRQAAVTMLNQEYPLPSYDWRTHLVSRG